MNQSDLIIVIHCTHFPDPEVDRREYRVALKFDDAATDIMNIVNPTSSAEDMVTDLNEWLGNIDRYLTPKYRNKVIPIIVKGNEGFLDRNFHLPIFANQLRRIVTKVINPYNLENGLPEIVELNFLKEPVYE